MLDLFSKWNEKGLNLSLSTPTLNVLSRWGKESPIRLKQESSFLDDTHDAIATSQSRTFGLPLTDETEEIIIEVQKRRVGRPRLSDTPAPVNLNVLKILEEEGVDLSTLPSTNAQGITVSLKAYLRNDFKIPEPTPDEMESVLRDIVHGEYKGLLGDRKTLLALNGLAAPKETAPVKVEEVELAEKVVFTATPTVQPRRAFTTPEPAGKKTMLDLSIVTDALTFDSHGRWKAGDLVSLSELNRNQRLSKEQGPAGNRRRDRQEIFGEVQADFYTTVSQVIRLANGIEAQTIGQMLNSDTLEIPETQKQKLLPFTAVPIKQLPKVMEAIKMHGGVSNRFKPVDQKSLLKYLLPEEKTK